MAKQNDKTLGLVQMALLVAIIFLLVFAIPPISAFGLTITLATIPVGVGSIILGYKKGAFLGFCFGLAQFLKNTFMPTITSFVFTPFYSLGEYEGNGWSLVISFLPRILVGVVPYLVYVGLTKALSNKKGSKPIALTLAGLSASVTNSVLVLGFICLFFGKDYSASLGGEVLGTLIMGTIATNAIPEAIVGAIIIPATCTVLSKVVKNNKIKK